MQDRQSSIVARLNLSINANAKDHVTRRQSVSVAASERWGRGIGYRRLLGKIMPLQYPAELDIRDRVPRP